MHKNHHSHSLQKQQQHQQNETTALVDVSSIMYGRKRKRGQFACDECDSVLTTAYSLQIHKRTHTGERPYVCHVCDYRSVCLSMLKRHVLTHSAEKPFGCDQCSKSFRQMAHLKVGINHPLISSIIFLTSYYLNFSLTQTLFLLRRGEILN